MNDPQHVMRQAAKLYDGLGTYQSLLLSKRYEEAEALRLSLASIWGEIQDDIRELGVPIQWGGSGRVFPTFEGALTKFDSRFPRPLLESIEHARTSLKIAEGKLTRVLKQQTPPDRTQRRHRPKRGKKVFVVHGHDSKFRQEVARFIRKIGLEPIVLQEQPNQGQTIIEKFVKHSKVTYAVVLLTPDDTGYPKTSPTLAQARARQNVILEMGYFMGALGRENICALLVGNIERPSDIDGILYIPANSDEWKPRLAKELKSAGFTVKISKA